MSHNGSNGEKRPFLTGQKAVSLTPSWEAQKLPNDELNLKGLTMTIAPPTDRFKIVLFIFILHGLGTLTPWNMFITAKSYFVDFKLDTGTNSTDVSSYATNFMQYVTFASQIPNLLFNWLNIFVNLGGDLTRRIVYSILLEIILFIITVVLAMMDSSSWPTVFFWITIMSVVILNMASGIYQNTIYGMVATLPPKYTGAVVLGSNLSGLFASIISICSVYIFTSKRTAAIYYFITALLVLLLCFDTYFALPINKFFRYHEMVRQKEKESQQTTATETDKIPYWSIFKQASPQLFNVFFVFFVTLSVFPAIHSDIKAVDENFFIPVQHFTSFTCFLTFNLFAMLGSLATSWIQWPKAQYLVIPVVIRAAFIPLFLFCNYIPKNMSRIVPVLIPNEYVYWAIAVVMAFSSGYLSSLGMMYAPQYVPAKNQVTAGMFAAAMLITGIFMGIIASFILPYFVAV